MLFLRIILLSIFLYSFSFAIEKVSFTPEEKNYIRNNPILKVGAEKDWPPFDFVEKGQYKGLAKDYLDLIAEKTGLTFEIIKGHTWPELLNLAKTNQIDILPIITKLPKRNKFLNFTQNYLNLRQYAFVNDNRININRISDLYGRNIAIPKGYASITYIKQNYPDINIIESKNILDSIDMLITNKVDAIIENNVLISYLLKEYNIQGVNPKFEVTLNSNKLAMATRKELPILRDILQKGLDSITDEEKNNITKKWISFQPTVKNITLSYEEELFLKEHPVLTIGNEFSWKPYDYFENNKAQGYSIDFIKLLANKVGFKTKFITDKWPTLTQKMKEKELDVLPILTKNKKRESFILFTDSYMSLKQVIITQKNRIDIQNVSDLNGKKVALVKGWNSTRLIQKHFPKINVFLVESTKEKLEAVAYGKADATIESFVISNYYIAEQFLNNLKITSKVDIPEYNNKMRIGIRKDLAPLQSIFNKALNSLTKDELLSLNTKWQTKINQKSFLDLSYEEQEFIKNHKVIMSGSKKWAPFIFTSTQDKAYGIIIDYWNLIAKKAGLQYNISLYDIFKDALLGIKTKEVDVLSSGETKDRLKYSIFSDTFESFPLSIATLDKEHYIPNAQSLVGKKIAVGKNFTAHKMLKDNYPNLELILTNNTPDALKLVAAGSVYAAVDAAPTLIYYINNLGLSNIKISGHTSKNFDLKFMVREDYPLLQSIINKTIKEITPTEKQEIYNRWIAVNYQQEFDYELMWKIIALFSVILAFFIYRHYQLIKYQKITKKHNDRLEHQSKELEKSNQIIQKTQEELESSLEHFISLVNSTIEAILIIKDDKIIYVNDEAVNLFEEESKESFMNKNILSFFTFESINELTQIIENQDTQMHEITALKHSGEIFPTLIKSKALQFQNIQAQTISIVDLTDLKNKEALIQEQSKMVAIGEMIGNIAHQWRQPLSIISTSSSAMQLYKDSDRLTDEIFSTSIQNILNNTQFLSRTIDDFRDFIQTDKHVSYFSVNKAVDKALSLIEATLKDSYIKVQIEIDNEVSIYNYGNELIQAMLNIFNNAKDAFLENVHIEERQIFITMYKKSGYVLIKIKDNAGGIPKQVLPHIFEPYFTTKHKSIGTGLGLFMTHKIISESMEGKIQVKNISYTLDNDSYKGAEFTLFLPLEHSRQNEFKEIIT